MYPAFWRMCANVFAMDVMARLPRMPVHELQHARSPAGRRCGVYWLRRLQGGIRRWADANLQLCSAARHQTKGLTQQQQLGHGTAAQLA